MSADVLGFPFRIAGTRSRRRDLAGLAALLVLLLGPLPARASCPADSALPLRQPARAAAAKSPNSAACAGLKSYEIIRAGAETAHCSAGNVVTGGSCSGIGNGGPSADGSAWECVTGERAIAICAALCSRAPDPEGACCQGTSCAQATASDCAAQGGVYQGDGVPCDPSTCEPKGACCLSSGGNDTCLDDQTPAECAGQGGVYLGDGVKCDTDPACLGCPNRPECVP